MGYPAGRVAKLGPTYTAGRGNFPLQWQSMLRYAGQEVHGVHSPYFNIEVNFDMAANTSLRMFSAEYLTDRHSPREAAAGRLLAPEDKFTTLMDKTSVAMRAAGLLGEEDPLSYAEIPFHLAGNESKPSCRFCVQPLLRNCHSRRLFILDTGYVGLAPARGPSWRSALQVCRGRLSVPRSRCRHIVTRWTASAPLSWGVVC
ncbi:hypothetical protein N657DRAFT_436500 [Parathielavia appendiculata]|uniref:Uncharacterized protein n=1 Tax=Parathielavia appendiculata TaxID=2587402 RepID=A0AAN6U054_9PEZI|nr:hypothetical protein N657DRAFT_436500 [Parathielavia appendiculata]